MNPSEKTEEVLHMTSKDVQEPRGVPPWRHRITVALRSPHLITSHTGRLKVFVGETTVSRVLTLAGFEISAGIPARYRLERTMQEQLEEMMWQQMSNRSEY